MLDNYKVFRYDELIEHLRTKDFNNILLFGTPRSGSTITSYILCKELELELIPEAVATWFGTAGEYTSCLSENNKTLIHSQNTILYIEDIHCPDTIKIIVKRDKRDIIRSCTKLNLFESSKKTFQYLDIWAKTWVDAYYNHCDRCMDGSTYFLEYESLKTTKYWIPKEERMVFGNKQVTKENDHIHEDMEIEGVEEIQNIHREKRLQRERKEIDSVIQQRKKISG